MNMNTRIRITALGFAVVLLLAGPAQAESGFYLGAGAGQSQWTDDPAQTSGQEVSESSTSYRGFAGYRLGIIPFLDFAAEIGYADLGKAEGTVGGTNAQYKAQGADASVLVIVPITLFDFYGRLGAMRVDLDKTFNGQTTSSSSTSGMYGLGVGFRFWKIGVRAEYDRIDIKDVKTLDVGMVSAYFQF
jgi:hypothetical protein